MPKGEYLKGKQEAPPSIKRRIGKPRTWDADNPEHVEKFIAKTNEYFDKCDMHSEAYTVTGLCIYLGMSDKRRIYEMCARDDAISELAKQARTIVEQQCEQRLCGKFNPGDLFKLKNFGWSDVQQVDMNLDGGSIVVVTGIPESEYEKQLREAEESEE